MSERNHAIENAAAWLESIREMIAAVGAAEEAGDSDAEEKAREAIQESPLCVVRGALNRAIRLNERLAP